MILNEEEINRINEIINRFIESEIGNSERLINMKNSLAENRELSKEDQNYFSEKLKQYKQIEEGKSTTPNPIRQKRENGKLLVLIAVICSVIVVFGIIAIKDYYDKTIITQEAKHYSQFMTKANSLEEQYMNDVQNCKNAHPTALPPNLSDFDACVKDLVTNYKSDFSNLVNEFGYENNFSRLYNLWTPQLQLQIDLTRIDIEYGKESSYTHEAIDPAEYWRQRYASINAGINP